MRKLILSAFACLFLCVGSAFAQMPITIAVDEISSDDTLVSFRKLLSEYVVTELAACNLIKVVGYDTVNNAKTALKSGNLAQADAKTFDALVKKLGADAICFGKVTRNADGIKADISVFYNGAKLDKSVTASMKGIENTDDAAKSIASQIDVLLKQAANKANASAKPYDCPTGTPAATPGATAEGAPAAGCCK
jgi:TolB-like protein